MSAGDETDSHTEHLKEILLARSSRWEDPFDFTDFSRDSQLRRVEDLHQALLLLGRAPSTEIDARFEETLAIVNGAHQQYSKGAGQAYRRSFIVQAQSVGSGSPARQISRTFPLLNPSLGTSDWAAFGALCGLPPFVYDTYTQSSDEHDHGAVIVSPHFTAITSSLAGGCTKLDSGEIEAIRDFLYVKSAEFARDQLGSTVLGVGTSVGRQAGSVYHDIAALDGISVTNGESGSILSTLATLNKILNECALKYEQSIGVIAGNSPMGAVLTHVLTESKSFSKRKIHLFDQVPSRRSTIQRTLSNPHRCLVVNDAFDLFNSCSVVINASDSLIDLDDLDPWEQLWLDECAIIELGPPLRFIPEQIAQRGGHMVWTVGTDRTEQRMITRDNRTTYGTTGLVDTEEDRSSVWGAETELAILASDRTLTADKAVPRGLERVRALTPIFNSWMEAAPFQITGKLIDLPLKS